MCGLGAFATSVRTWHPLEQGRQLALAGIVRRDLSSCQSRTEVRAPSHKAELRIVLAAAANVGYGVTGHCWRHDRTIVSRLGRGHAAPVLKEPLVSVAT